MIRTFTEQNLQQLYNTVAEKDAALQNIITTYGYPPLWVRPNSFATLVLTILEQQVSLASAYAAFKKLQQRLPQIEPHLFLQLTDDDLRGCSFTRQKIRYTRGLAQAICNDEVNLTLFESEEDAAVRSKLTALKGIGNWTVDIYLLHALQRTDVFPLGDLALIKALQSVKATTVQTTKEELLQLAAPWQPNRSMVTMLLWHWYIKTKGIVLLH